MPKKMSMGHIVKVDNKDRKFGANAEYYGIKVQHGNGEECYLLFTEHQLKVAHERAAKNPEDIIPTGPIEDFFD